MIHPRNDFGLRETRLLFVVARGDAFGGSSLHVLELADRLRGAGYQTRVVVGGEPHMEVPRRFAARGIDFQCLPSMRREMHPGRDLKAVSGIRREIRRFAPDLVSFHSSKAGGVGRMAALGLGIPCLYTPHCWAFVDGFPRARVYRTLERLLAPVVSRIIAVSEDERTYGLRKGVGRPEQVTTIHNGVRDCFSTGCAPRERKEGEPVRIVMVGRFEPQKNHELLIRSLARLERLPWTLTLVGEGPLRPRVEELVRKTRLADRVEFAGYTDEVEEVLARHDLFVLTSNWEGFPRSILEAMSASLPVVASDVGGCREAVVNGETGFIVPPNDADALDRALGELLGDPEKLARMGRIARERYLAEFTLEGMVERYLDLYDSVLASCSVHSPVAERGRRGNRLPSFPSRSLVGPRTDSVSETH